MRESFLTLLFAGLPFTTCLNPDGDVICTMEFVYGVNVTLTDAQTGQGISGAVLTLIDSSGTEIMEEAPNQTGQYYGAGERPGTYALTVQAAGYQETSQQNIVVTSDECHVIPVHLDIQMNPI
ncbi:MAG: carboxypeptidase regulatory-like domain-containing protein [Planctomycetota bacterium]|nr:MAG: carboxypeptidase regulatory-like domain-containing protein [Planctomycetota bacterium]